jgi:enamine deaminase RidA (YjgF/YER057c/UK114 family)
MWPLTWVEGASCTESPLAGVQVLAMSGCQIKRVQLGNRVVGSVFEDEHARHCVLGGLGPTAVTLLAPAQVQQMLGNMECALDLAGFELADVVRTWFYNENILSWYGDFNRVRTAHYANVKFRTRSTPASTGVAGRNPAGAALAVAAWAVQPLKGDDVAREIGSPLQCPAPNYGSSFSRAMEIESGGYRRLFISGTASIEPGGKTVWVGNAKKQIDLTMDVVGAILQSRGMDFENIQRAIAYFQHPAFKPYFDAWCVKRGLRELPVIAVNCDICRDDLLFEIEVDAVVPSVPGTAA